MPHFIIDCSENVLRLKEPKDLMRDVHDTADSTGLFAKGNIKVRIRPYSLYNVANTEDDFIHVFANIMGGRTPEQKKDLSHRITKMLKDRFPDVPVISINVIDFDVDSYCNKGMV